MKRQAENFHVVVGMTRLIKMPSYWFGDVRATGLVTPWFVLIGAFRSSLRLLLIGGFRSLSFSLEIVPSAVRLGTDRLLCCLIVGIHASGISIPLSLLMLSV